MQELHRCEKNISFYNLRDEIEHFKLKRPNILKWEVFYRQLKIFEEYFPIGGWKKQRNYIRHFQKKVYHFFLEKSDFFAYLKAYRIDRDKELFTRKSKDRDINAQIQATFLFDEYLLSRLNEISDGRKHTPIEKKKDIPFTWSDNKLDLILLAYALYEKKAINAGQVTLKEIIRQFEKLFNIVLSNHSRRFIELQRKREPNQYLLDLVDVIEQKIENLY